MQREHGSPVVHRQPILDPGPSVQSGAHGDPHRRRAQGAQPLRAGCRRAARVRRVGGRRRVRRRPVLRPAAVHDRRAAAQRDRRAAHGARAERRDPGHADPAARHAGLRDAVDLRHRPRRHRHPERGGEGAAEGRAVAPRPGTRGLRGARLGVASRVRRRDHPAVQAAGLRARLRQRAVHDGRPVRPRGARGVRRPLRQGLHLPGQPDRQLVPQLRVRHLRPRGALRARRRHAVRGALPGEGRHRAAGGGDRAAGDDPRRHRGGRASRRRALPAPGRRHGDRADRRPRGADHRRRVREDGLRHRRAQGDAGPRPQRLRDRPPARARGADGDRVRRPDDRGRRRVRGADRGRRPSGGGRPVCSSSDCSATSSRTSTRSATATAAATGSSR